MQEKLSIKFFNEAYIPDFSIAHFSQDKTTIRVNVNVNVNTGKFRIENLYETFLLLSKIIMTDMHSNIIKLGIRTADITAHKFQLS